MKTIAELESENRQLRHSLSVKLDWQQEFLRVQDAVLKVMGDDTPVVGANPSDHLVEAIRRLGISQHTLNALETPSESLLQSMRRLLKLKGWKLKFSYPETANDTDLAHLLTSAVFQTRKAVVRTWE